MSETEQDRYPAYDRTPMPQSQGVGRVQRMINLFGALGSLGIVAFLAWWGWDLAMRDARGVPVVRAIEGPLRIAPTDPGGRVVDHQGLAVNDIAALGETAPVADRLTLAPAPVQLTLEDLPGLHEASTTPLATQPVRAPEQNPAIASAVATEAPPQIEASQPDLPEVDAPADTAQTAVIDDPVALALAEALGMTPEEMVQAQPQLSRGIERSLRPRSRPEDGLLIAASASSSAPVVAADVVPTEIAVTTLEPGTRLVQFGAYDSDATARSEWAALSARFPALMASKSMVIQTAESGGQTFWRLRAHGFENEQESRRFCAAIEAEGARCIPVAHR